MEQDSKPVKPETDSLKDAAQGAAGTASDVESTMKAAASQALDTGRAYAQDAVEAAGKKVERVKLLLDDSQARVVKVVTDEPLKAVLVTFVVGAVLGALLASAVRTNNRFY